MRRQAVILIAAWTLGLAAPAEAKRKKKAPPAPAASDPKDVAALGRAYALFRDGKYAEAYREAKPLVGAKLLASDYALYVAAQSASLSGDRAAALPLFRRLAKERGSRFRAVAAWRVADSLWDLGDLEGARKAYEPLLGKPGGERAVALHRIGAAHAKGGRSKKALASWRRLALEHPAHPLADAVLAELTLSARDRLARAETLTRDRAWDRALEELALVGDDEPEEIRDLRDYWIGTTLFKMRRRYERAGDLLVGVHEKLDGRAAEALFHGARAYSRADRDDDAIKWYGEVVRKYPRTSYASEAQFLIGWLDFNRGRYREAIPGLEKTLEDYGGSKWSPDARWYLAFSHFLLGEHADALPHLEKLVARGGGALAEGKARYWRARTLDALGRTDDAIGELRDVVTKFPFSWYAQLARARLAERELEVGPYGDAAAPDGDGAPTLDRLDPKLAADPLIARVDELVAAGLTVEAGWELDRGETGFVKKHGRGRALPLLFDRYRRAGNFHRPWLLAVSYGGRAFKLRPEGTAKLWWEAAYPLAYRDHIEKWRDLGKNPTYYLYAIMLKESGFNPHDVSYADAIGLLQMIPPTTRRVAPAIGLEYTDDLLYDPELNVRVASWYIGGLLQKFKMQIPIGAGSFNCGPRPVMRWLEQFGDRPTDEFVELVAYTQTREYMKKVADIYARYLWLYEEHDHTQPLTVDRTYVENDLVY